jgi:hypothetical protein
MEHSLNHLTKLNKQNHTLVVLTGAVALILLVKYNNLPQIQFLIATILIMLYLLWAILHHHNDKTLRVEVMVEYVLTALLSLIILYGILL